MRIQISNPESAALDGVLYMVGTPIGNLEDITFRAVRILKEADIIAAEDTRQTRKLLNHYEIGGRLVSYHEHNKAASGAELVRLMSEGAKVALVSDAGLPGISDPGADLAHQAAEAGIPVIPVPGANAALSALMVSALPTDSFAFFGFLPRDNKRRKAVMNRLEQCGETIILYESPHRLLRTLDELLERLGDRRMAMARELTKKYEEIARGSVSECRNLLEHQPPRGEYCLILAGAETEKSQEEEANRWADTDIGEHVQAYILQGMTKKDAMKKAAADRGWSKRDVYQALLRKDKKISRS